MKRILLSIVAVAAVASLMLVGNPGVATAQFGFGAGLVAAGDNVSQAQGELADLFAKENISAGDISGDIGLYLSGRFRLGMGPVRLLGDASYLFFKAKEVTLTEASANPGDTSASGTFDVGTSMYPIAAGVAFALPIPVVKPYVGAQLSYTLINRTFTRVSGGADWQTLGVENKSAGDPELGMTVNAGAEFNLAFATLDVGARYNLTNLFSQENGEAQMRYLQVGASLFFGSSGN